MNNQSWQHGPRVGHAIVLMHVDASINKSGPLLNALHFDEGASPLPSSFTLLHILCASPPQELLPHPCLLPCPKSEVSFSLSLTSRARLPHPFLVSLTASISPSFLPLPRLKCESEGTYSPTPSSPTPMPTPTSMQPAHLIRYVSSLLAF